METKKIKQLISLNNKKLKKKVKDIKALLPVEDRYVITYSKNFTLSLSNYCINQCGYCVYNNKVPKLNSEENVALLSINQIGNLIKQAQYYDCKEALIMSGECPENFPDVKKELEKFNYSYFIEFVKDVCIYLLDFNILPHTNLGYLSYNELKNLKKYNASMGLMLESTSKKLFEKGGVHENSPGKCPERRLEHIRNAGKLQIPFTTGLLLGIGETIRENIEDLYLIKKINNEYGHIQEVIIQNFIKKKNIPYQPKKSITIEKMLKVVGLAKVILENDISIQVPPNLIAGFEREFIDMGIDDFGGISSFTLDYINPDNQWPQIEDLFKICEIKGYNLKERLPIYEKFIKKEGFCSENIKKIINNINLNDRYSAC